MNKCESCGVAIGDEVVLTHRADESLEFSGVVKDVFRREDALRTEESKKWAYIRVYGGWKGDLSLCSESFRCLCTGGSGWLKTFRNPQLELFKEES